VSNVGVIHIFAPHAISSTRVDVLNTCQRPLRWRAANQIYREIVTPSFSRSHSRSRSASAMVLSLYFSTFSLAVLGQGVGELNKPGNHEVSHCLAAEADELLLGKLTSGPFHDVDHHIIFAKFGR
jgi:hypothetical protein